MRTLGVILCFLFCSKFCSAQTSAIDSLKIRLTEAESVREKVEIFGKLSNEIWDYDFEQGLNYALDGYELAVKNNYQRGEILSTTNIGQYYYYKGIYPTAKRYFLKAINDSRRKSFDEYPALTFNRLGNLYRGQSSFDSADYCYTKALSLLDSKVKFNRAIAAVLDNRGAMQVSLSQFEEAIKTLGKSIEIRKSLGDSLALAESWKELGHAFAGLGNYDSAQFFYNEIDKVAARYHNDELKMISDIYQGELNHARGNYDQALRHCIKALDHLKIHDFKKYKGYNLRLIGLIYYDLGNVQQALKYYFESIKVNEELGARQELAKLYLSIGWAYVDEGLDSLSLNFANLSLSTSKKINDLTQVATANNLVGYIFYKKKNFDASLTHYEEALSLREALKNLIGVSSTSYNIARLYEAQGLNEKALDYYLRSVSIAEKFKDQSSLAAYDNAIGFLFLKMNRTKDAQDFLAKGMKIATSNMLLKELLENYRYQADLNRTIGKASIAISFYEKFMTLNDSVHKMNNQKNMAQMSAIYQLEKKEQEIQNLSHERELSRTEIEFQKTQLLWQRGVLIVSLLGIICLIGLVIILFMYYRAKSKAHKELDVLNKNIHEQKEEIQAQSEELIEANFALSTLNTELLEKTEEIRAQAEELISANQKISEINKGLEDSIEARTLELRQAYKELDTFFYRASHDFRRPLTTFMGLSEVAKVTVKDANALELFEKVSQTAYTLDKMLFKLQSISDLGGQHLIAKEVFVKELIDEVLDLFKNEIQRQKISIVTQIQGHSNVKSYPTLIRIIVENLIENSIHFASPQSPSILIKVLQMPDFLTIEVSDNGEGIEEEYQTRIFEMYFRASERSKGNGLGLYITKKAIDKLAGKLDFTSLPGKGTSFSIQIPSI